MTPIKKIERTLWMATLLGATLASSPAWALLGDMIFEQDFANAQDIFDVGGKCGGSNGTGACDTVLANGGVEFKNGTPLLWYPKADPGDSSKKYIDPEKGTIRFTYTPLNGSGWGGDWQTAAPTGTDWTGYNPKEKSLFRLYDPTRPNRSNLMIGTFYEPASRTNYLYVRYDTTDNCTLDWSAGGCYHATSSRASEPAVIMAWTPDMPHTIVATWDFSGARPFLGISVDGIGGYWDKAGAVDITSFAPTGFYIGSDGSGTGIGTSSGRSAQGRIDNLQIYDSPALVPAYPGESAKTRTADDGVWQPYETRAETDDAPLRTIGSAPFIFYNSYAYEPILEGSIPAGSTDPADMTIDVAKDQFETQFFNIYTNQNDLGVVTASVSNLTSGAHVIDQDQIKIRTVKNWFQAGGQVARDPLNVVYTPELLVFDDRDVENGVDVPRKLKCTGTNGSCANTQLPSDPAQGWTETVVPPMTSRQFAITLHIPAEQPAGLYTGTITVDSENHGEKTLPLKVMVHDYALPAMDKIVALYHGNQLAVSTAASYLSETVFELQLDNMRDHGVNGMLFGGQAWNLTDARKYPDLSVEHGLGRFGAYKFNASFPLTNSVQLAQRAYLLESLEVFEENPYLYGVDEPHVSDSRMVNHLEKSAAIHDAGGKVVVAITKEWADKLNNPSLPAFKKRNGVDEYAFNDIKLDLPNLLADGREPFTHDYFIGLLNGTATKPAHKELYYWQMYREDPRINRFYTGYHLYLTDLDGVMPFAHQWLLSNPFDDFDIPSDGAERDMNTVYPSLQGGIDTMQWEAFRAGLDDYRLLTLWRTLHGAIALQPGNNAAAYQSALDARLVKYRNPRAFDVVSRADFAADRQFLLGQLDAMTVALKDADDDGIGDAYDNCKYVDNGDQADADNNDIGDVCEPGLVGDYFNYRDSQWGRGFVSGGPVLTRVDANVDFDWGLASPAAGLVNTDEFSVRWTGSLLPPVSGTYTFCTVSDDGATLWVGGEDPLFDFWIPQDSLQRCGTVALTANQPVPIRLEFFDDFEEGIIRLYWAYPGQALQIIPAANLFHAQ